MSHVRELSCQEIVELVTDYVEGTMEQPLRGAFDAHLEQCDGCTEYIEQIRATIRIAGRIEAAALPADFRVGLVEAFRDFAAGRHG